MPEIGEIARGKDLGITPDRGWFVWAPCAICDKPRWERFCVDTCIPKYDVCKLCSRRGKQNQWYVNGKSLTKEGYIRVRIYPGNSFYPMADTQGRVMEHRLVMARHLGRCLHGSEVVHHRGTIYPMDSIENRQDNRLENLELTTNGEHVSQHRQNEVYNGIDPFHGYGYKHK